MSILCLLCVFNIPNLQADDPTEAAKDILARAAARGIISGVSGDPTTAGGAASTATTRGRNLQKILKTKKRSKKVRSRKSTKDTSSEGEESESDDSGDSESGKEDT